MAGELLGDTVLVRDEAEASQIYNKGFYGYPMSGGCLELDLMEATYLLECGRLEVKESGESVLLSRLTLRAAETIKDFEVSYIVYRDLRQRGYVVKAHAGDFNFRVFPRGGTPTSSPTRYWVLALSERSLFDLKGFMDQMEQAERTRKTLLLAVVDEEGDITYYQASKAFPEGWESDAPGGLTSGVFIEHRVMIFDQDEAERVHKNGFFGKMIGSTLQLSLIETAYLQEHGLIELRSAASGRKISPVGFARRASRLQPDFQLRLRVYTDLREKGLVVKTGFKYGCHFRVYERDPEKIHARFLVHAVPSDYSTIWPEISRAVRLAHGVRKEILFGMVGEKVDYLRLRRVRP
jgi:tRNA-intron endonuclease, archaea type